MSSFQFISSYLKQSEIDWGNLGNRALDKRLKDLTPDEKRAMLAYLEWDDSGDKGIAKETWNRAKKMTEKQVESELKRKYDGLYKD